MGKQRFYYKVFFSDSAYDPVVCNRYEIGSIDPHFYMEGRAINAWPPVALFYGRGTEVEDYIVNPLGWPVVSERVRRVILDVAPAEVQFLPIRIIGEQSGKELDGYSVLNTLRIIEALDRQHARYQEDPNEPKHPIIIKPALIEGRVAGTHIFRLHEQQALLLVSDTVKAELERNDVTGFRFAPVPAY